ncbi:cell division protein FtsA [Criibacterium bergeronii]|uniref:Chaperone protein DnaK n=1 Tax=Criibacterium bergeronii TaxID=1871336 RepID=A0A371IIS7_9FIRM|nr:cell division FtsA domain-containing protein [Criibacterium bergeronii]MBS6062847.1 pilus assembly protein PilM [Peptostreptococcaceae bacterium]RDY20379.1 cell division protein FtsA [Criibacterium bergeronii]TRW27685.1 cell division protein FtsA [Criibacterium bergeronii]
MIEDENLQDVFFSLDVGTRDVIGILGKMINERLVITNIVIQNHKSRAMYDGQVHDIQAVAEVVKSVKKMLEEETGFKLHEVSVAAAGRSLRTIQAECTFEFEEETEISPKIIKKLDMEVLQKASDMIKENVQEGVPYYNVGHTVMKYKLDDYEIKNPEGQKGKKLTCEMIATFLPKVVIEALESVVKRADLSVSYMDLEPVVALEVTVPENVRLLNIAMVDIGAGTSDIAITRDGTIVGYEMTSTAGDEITEALSRTYLLDFDTAENLKCNLMYAPTQKFSDIIGSQMEVDTEEILDKIEDSIDLVAKNIADGIVKVNGKSPSAVFLVGGGSQIPRINKLIAQYLDIQPERVVVKNPSSLKDIEGDEAFLSSPQSIMPVGLLQSTIKNHTKDFLDVSVNDEDVRLFRAPGLRVGDALILSGFNPKDLIARKGKSLLIYLNGKEKLFSSDYGTEAIITLNGEKAGIDSAINDGDKIFIEPAVRGEDISITLGEAVGEEYITFESKKLNYAYNIILNGTKTTDFNLQLQNGDKLYVEYLDTIEKFKDYMDLHDISLCVNDKISMNDTTLYPNDVITVLGKADYVKAETISPKTILQVTFNGRLVTIKSNKQNPIFVDVFEFANFDTMKSSGKALITKLNGQPAEYTTPIKAGDNLEVYWEN